MTKSIKWLGFLVLLSLVLPLLLACVAPATPSPVPTTAPTSAAATSVPSTKAGVTPTPVPSTKPTTATPKYGGVLRVRADGDTLGWDPHTTKSWRDYLSCSFVYSKLVQWPMGPEYDASDFTPTPDLAESWDIPNDKTYIFHLRKGVKFQNRPPVNGRELVAEDVVYSIKRLMEAKPPRAYIVPMIDTVEAIDKYTVKLTTKEPYAPLLVGLADPSTGDIIAKEARRDYEDFMRAETAIGTGPFLLESHEKAVKSVFKKNSDYFKKGLPYVDEIRWLTIEDLSTALSALRARTIDIGTVERPELAAVKQSNPDMQFYEYLYGGGRLFVRTDKLPFNDERVRQAMSMALDRESWIKHLYMGRGEIQGPVVQTALRQWALPIDQLGEAKKYFQYNPNESKKLLADVGYPKGITTTLNFTPGYGVQYVEWMELVKDMFSKVGIDVKIELKEYTAHMATTYLGNYEGVGFTPSTVYSEVDRNLFSMHEPGSSSNQSHVDDPVLWEMVLKQRGAVDPTARKKIVDEIQRYSATKIYYLWVPANYLIAAFQPWVKNYRSSSGYERGRIFEMVWLDKS